MKFQQASPRESGSTIRLVNYCKEPTLCFQREAAQSHQGGSYPPDCTATRVFVDDRHWSTMWYVAALCFRFIVFFCFFFHNPGIFGVFAPHPSAQLGKVFQHFAHAHANKGTQMCWPKETDPRGVDQEGPRSRLCVLRDWLPSL